MLPFLLEHRFVEEKDSFGHGPNNESFQQSNLKLGALKLGLKKRGFAKDLSGGQMGLDFRSLQLWYFQLFWSWFFMVVVALFVLSLCTPICE